MLKFHDVELAGVRVLLCDADGNLFPSEEPAFAASTEVTNAFLTEFGIPVRLTAEQLRTGAAGKNFRTTAVDLCVTYGVPIVPALATQHHHARTATTATTGGRPVLTSDALEHWVAEERRHVSVHLGRVLRPDAEVLDPLGRLDAHLTLAAVSSSAASRLDVCFTATGLTSLIPAVRRYSAEDSLPVPTSKPDPAVYRFACRAIGCPARQGLAVEDSLSGVQSAVAAGIPTIGNVMFAPDAERAERIQQLRDAGVAAIVTSWRELADLLLPVVGGPGTGVCHT